MRRDELTPASHQQYLSRYNPEFAYDYYTD